MIFRVRHLAVLAVLAVAVPLFASHACIAAVPGMKKPSGKAQAPLVEPTDPQDVPAFMARLTDEEARALLQAKLAAQAAPAAQDSGEEHGSFLLGLFVRLEKSVREGLARHERLLAKAQEELSGVDVAANLTGGGTSRSLLYSLLALAAVLAGALAASTGAGRLCDTLTRRSPGLPDGPGLGRTGRVLSNLLRSALAVAAFFLAAFALYMALLPAAGNVRTMGVIAIVGLSYYLLVKAVARVLLSPEDGGARLIPIRDEDALTLYRWLMAIALASALLGVSGVVLKNLGKAPALGDILYAQAGPVVGLLLTGMILANRSRVAGVILGRDGGQHFGARSLAARFWHYPAVAYALVIGFFWSSQALSGDATILLLVLSLFLIPCAIGVDLWVGKLLAAASGEDREVIDLTPEERGAGEPVHPAAPDRKTIRYYIPFIRKSLRVVLVAFAAFAMLKTWGVEIPLGWLFARNVLSVLLVGVGGLLVWEVIRIRIDRRLSEETSLPGDEMEEGGGAGGSRSATLLMLLRKFLLCVIVVMGSLVALSSLGVDIGPLIAGAGVIGLAIGFGAQTLVKDIISGVFFLIDDAFRVGDYVEAGTAKGTVEQISLRSMKLRHPRGMVFTIPYGGLKILQNYSRDYIISKLDFRVRYDADIAKIRKIIKRINKELMANEEISRGMLSDIKSMGVRKMEDSAMILRIKFKTVPGHQFLVEKELYRRVQEAFRKNGIEFAHRNVTVYFPPEFSALAAGEKQMDEAARQALGAAAASALAAEEEEKLAALKAAKPKAE